jgi:hypothetical protein
MKKPNSKDMVQAIVASAVLLIPGCVTDDEARLVQGLVSPILGAVPGMAGISAPYIAPAVQAGQGIVNAVTAHVIAKNRATQQQQQLAEARGAEYYRQLSPQQRSSAGRNLAVSTSASPGSKGKPVMIYDTQTGKTTGTVYNVKSTPSQGKTMIIESTPATYIGRGSTPATYL